MNSYLIIESRDPQDSFLDAVYLSWIHDLPGESKTMFLTQNAVIATRKNCTLSTTLIKLQHAGIKIVADNFYVTEKSIHTLADGVETIDIDQVVEKLMDDNTKTIWH